MEIEKCHDVRNFGVFWLLKKFSEAQSNTHRKTKVVLYYKNYNYTVYKHRNYEICLRRELRVVENASAILLYSRVRKRWRRRLLRWFPVRNCRDPETRFPMCPYTMLNILLLFIPVRDWAPGAICVLHCKM